MDISFLDKSLENNEEQESCCKNISPRDSRVQLLFNRCSGLQIY